jgi:predicted membrane protein
MSTTRHIVPLGGLRERVEGVAPDQIVQVALIGGANLDLSAATIPPAGTTILKVAVVGGLDVTVPAGTRVEVSGFALIGPQRVVGGSTGADAAVVRIRHFGIFGGITVRTV